MSGFQSTEVLAICSGNTVSSSGTEEPSPRIPGIGPQYFACDKEKLLAFLKHNIIYYIHLNFSFDQNIYFFNPLEYNPFTYISLLTIQVVSAAELRRKVFYEKIIVCHWLKIWSAKISANSKQICFQKLLFFAAQQQKQLGLSVVIYSTGSSSLDSGPPLAEKISKIPSFNKLEECRLQGVRKLAVNANVSG